MDHIPIIDDNDDDVSEDEFHDAVAAERAEGALIAVPADLPAPAPDHLDSSDGDDDDETQEDPSVADVDMQPDESLANAGGKSASVANSHEATRRHSRFSFGRRNTRSVSFDRRLPASHAYLGQNMEDVGGGQTIHDINSVLEGVCLFPVPHLILMPGQNLPLQSLHPRAIAMFRHIISNQRVFGVISMRYRSLEGQELANIGTLAQIIAFKEETEHEVTTVKLRAVGRQRFELLETLRQIDGTLTAKVKILPEIMLSDALDGARLPSLDRFRVKPFGSTTQSENAMCSRFAYKSDKYFAAHFTSLPGFVYKQYDIVRVIEEIKQELAEWYRASSSMESMGDSPVEFSFWVAANLPVEDSVKMHLLGINSALQRLRLELCILRKCTLLRCRECGEEIGKRGDVMSMSVEGPMGAYVNSYGFVHETLTLRNATGLEMIGQGTTENSWFPGYEWRICQCRRCRSHVGWRFKAVTRGLDPKVFWGITRSAILPSMAEPGAAGSSQEDDSPEDIGLVM